jgi:hypothetical protein
MKMFQVNILATNYEKVKRNEEYGRVSRTEVTDACDRSAEYHDRFKIMKPMDQVWAPFKNQQWPVLEHGLGDQWPGKNGCDARGLVVWWPR